MWTRLPISIPQMKEILTKIRMWGWGGVKNYLTEYRYRRQIVRAFAAQIRRDRGRVPERGITLVGTFTQQNSHSKVLRDFAWNLKAAGIPFQTLNVDRKPSLSGEEVDGILTPRDAFRITRFDHVVELTPLIIPQRLGLPLSRILFWEFESGVLYAYPELVSVPRVIAMSDFNAAYFRKTLPDSVRVDKILYPFRFSHKGVDEPAVVRERYGIPREAFMVFSNFDLGSSYYRKNPEGALRAFSIAFGNRRNAALVMKVMGAKARPDLMEKLLGLADELGIRERLVVIDRYIPERNIYGLSNACDVYLSLHRGEGFGITLAEAMVFGKPVVCTDYSSTTEFCRPDGTFSVPFSRVAVRPDQVDHPYYSQVQEWAEPDVAAAAEQLRWIYGHPDAAKQRGEQGRRFVESYFSIDHFRQDVSRFLDH